MQQKFSLRRSIALLTALTMLVSLFAAFGPLGLTAADPGTTEYVNDAAVTVLSDLLSTQPATTTTGSLQAAVDARLAENGGFPGTTAVATATIVTAAQVGEDGLLRLSVVVTTVEAPGATGPTVVSDPVERDVVIPALPDVAADIIIFATGRTDAWINLTAETIHLPTGFTTAQRSVNGGTRWSRGAIPANTAALFNRELTLWVRNTVGETADTVEIRFPAIAARPRINHASTERFAPWYSADTWTLRVRPVRENTVTSPPNVLTHSYEYWLSTDARGRLVGTASDPIVWTVADTRLSGVPADGFAMLPPRVPNDDGSWNPQGERTARPSYWFRLAPTAVTVGATTTYTPASRAVRIRPVLLRVPTAVRPNYALETMPTRLGQEFSTTLDTGLNRVWFTHGDSAEAVLGTGYTLLNANGRAVPLSLTDQITATTQVRVRTAATGRRARSVDQVINPQPRRPLTADVTTATALNILPNGRINTADLVTRVEVGGRNVNIAYNIWVPERGRWAAVPRINANHGTPVPGSDTERVATFPIRKNPSARIVSRAWTGEAASLTGTLTVYWGVIGRNSRNTADVLGVRSAYITPAGVAAPPAPPLWTPPPAAN
ncbi:MAG: hypothetical protein FWF80_08800 [Defluviitaleaceae bacterium]|nr:hypothetical protein [Defluviitaleaceae bacterium]